MLTIRFFGPPEIHIGNAPVRRLTASPTLTQLFAYCVTYRHQPHTREKLAALLWPDLPEARARRNLNNALWEMRQLFKVAHAPPEDYWLSDSQTVQFNPAASLWLDAVEFETLTALLRQSPPKRLAQDVARLERAAALYRGDYLEGLYADWCAPFREQFRETYLVLLEALTQHYQSDGRLQEALRTAQTLAQTDPLREEAHFQLVQLYAALERLPEAIAQYERYVTLWQTELRAAPSARMEALFRQINSDANLASPSGEAEALAHNLEIIKTLTAFLNQRPPRAQPSTIAVWQTVAEHSEQTGRQLKTRSANTNALEYFEIALGALAHWPASRERDRRELNLRRECDEIYDLLADTPAQKSNLQRALKLAEQINAPAERADVLARQAWLARRQSKHQQAIQLLQTMLEVCQHSSAQIYAALAYRLLGITYDEIGDFQTALEQHTQALKIDQKRQQPQGLYLDHINLSSVLTGMGHYSQAMRHLEKATLLASPDKQSLIEVTIAGNRGNLWLKLGQFDLAHEQIQPAIKRVRQTGDREIECWLGGRLALLYQRQDAPHAALQLAHHYYRWAIEIRAPRRAVELTDILAILYIGANDGANALEWANLTADLASQHNLRRYQLRGKLRQAQALNIAGKQQSALKKIRMAVTLFEDWAQPMEEETELFWTLAQCSQSKNNIQATARARASLRAMAKQHVSPKWRQAFLENHPCQIQQP